MQQNILKDTKSLKILLVDDEADILHALGIFLEQEGHTVEAVTNFRSYRNKINESNLPDVIILDILLNQEDGCKIAKELKQNPITSKVPIIMISALPNGKEKSEEAGSDAFLAKPFDVTELNEKIESLTKT